MRKEKISEVIGSISEKYVNEATAYTGEAKVIRHNRWMNRGTIAACFALIAVLGIAIFQSAIFRGSDHVVTLDNGSTLTFTKTNSALQDAALDIAFTIETRDLTENEISTLFNDLPITAYAIFNSENDSILGLEGQIGEMKLIVSAAGYTLNDTIIDEGNEKTSDINGIPVIAGYMVTDANSKGEKYIIYYATFDLGDNTVYVEHAGLSDNAEIIRNEIVSVIQSIIDLGEINLTQIAR